MSAQWTNKFAIMRDLSMVQGCVPGDIEGTLGKGEKPPAPDIVEENEEEFFRKYTSSEDGAILMPNFEHIKMYLEMVHDVPSPEEEDQNNLMNTTIYELNPLTKEFVPKSLDTENDTNNTKNILSHTKTIKSPTRNGKKLATGDFEDDANNKIYKNETENATKLKNLPEDVNNSTNNVVFTSKIYKNRTRSVTEPRNASPVIVSSKDDNNKDSNSFKRKKKRNIAFESFLNMDSEKNIHVEKEIIDTATQPKPEVKKTVKNSSTFLLNPTSMFKMKSDIKKEVPPEKKNLSPFLIDPRSMFKVKTDVPTVVPSNPISEIPKIKSPIQQYVPSKQAEEYYKKYVERSKVARQAKEDIWSRAERLMKEIDERRKEEAELLKLQEAALLSEISNDNVIARDTSSAIQSSINKAVVPKNLPISETSSNNTSLLDSTDSNEDIITDTKVMETSSKNISLADYTSSDNVTDTSFENKTSQNDDTISSLVNETASINVTDNAPVHKTHGNNVAFASLLHKRFRTNVGDVICTSGSSEGSPPLQSSPNFSSEVLSKSSSVDMREPYLSRHRHLLGKDCIVCKIMCRERSEEDNKLKNLVLPIQDELDVHERSQSSEVTEGVFA